MHIHESAKNASSLCMFECLCVHVTFKHNIQPQMSSYQPITNLHLCVGSVLLHMWELALITHHLRPCSNDWLTDGRISHDKKLKWLITEAHLSTWGGLACQGLRAPRGWTFLGLSTWHPGADSPAHGSVWSSSLLYVCKQPLIIPTWNIYSTAWRQEN